MNKLSGDLPTDAILEYPIAVVVPTYNRSDCLIYCLECLEQQTCKDFEVLVVDDGSEDETLRKIQEYKDRTSLHLRFFSQANAGPARARNIAISFARAPIILMIGDDILASRKLIETHLAFHRRQSKPQAVGLGLTRWEEHHQEVTPFMRFLEEGPQFAYSDLIAGKAPSAMHFYTSNLSLKKEVLRRNPFCERFPKASFEDLELGWRIMRTEGMEIAFLPEALAYHLHPTTFTQACGRMRCAGWSAHLMYEIWPDTYSHPAGGTSLRRFIRRLLTRSPLLHAATQIAAMLSAHCSARTLFRAVLGAHFFLGYQDRDRECRCLGEAIPASRAAAGSKVGTQQPSLLVQAKDESKGRHGLS